MNDSPTPRVLVVEDEQHLAAGLKLNLELEGYDVDVAGTAREAGALLLGERAFDMILLDVMLPDVDGFSFCRKLRSTGNTTPVLMLTARGGVEDRVEGLNVGADDYLTKPFELDELLARVRSMLRRQSWQKDEADEPPPRMTLGPATIDFDKHRAERAGEELHLTKLEFDLLRYFAANPERVLSRQELQREVWRLQDYPNRRMVDNFIMRLRRHFEDDPSEPRFFLSVRGAGYKYVPE